jgi:hypothetical protein
VPGGITGPPSSGGELGESRIWDSKMWSWVPSGWDLKMTALARASISCYIRTITASVQLKKKRWSWVSRGLSPRRTDWRQAVSCKVNLTGCCDLWHCLSLFLEELGKTTKISVTVVVSPPRFETGVSLIKFRNVTGWTSLVGKTVQFRDICQCFRETRHPHHQHRKHAVSPKRP